jgi:hypothetical protein
MTLIGSAVAREKSQRRWLGDEGVESIQGGLGKRGVTIAFESVQATPGVGFLFFPCLDRARPRT